MRQSRYHPLEAVADFHLRFEAIHPFIDGNGRTGRLLLNLMLAQTGYQPIDVKYTDRQRYYDAFDTFENGGTPASMASLIAHYEQDTLVERIELAARSSQPSDGASDT